MIRALLTAAVALLTACDDGRTPSEPLELDVRGNYTLVELRFDPQGSLGPVDLLPRIEGTVPALVLVHGGRAQLVFRDPETGLITLADASYSVTDEERVRLQFDDRSTLHQRTFLSSDMSFVFTEEPRTLAFSGTPTGGIDRRTLLQLVPEWSEEQLFDPVPGELTVTYRVTD